MSKRYYVAAERLDAIVTTITPFAGWSLKRHTSVGLFIEVNSDADPRLHAILKQEQGN